MKNLLKRVLTPIWRMTAFARRPLGRRLDQRAEALLARSFQTQLIPQLIPHLNRVEGAIAALEASTQATTHATNVMAYDMNLVLNGVVRELARLQMQIEVLQHLSQDEAPSQGGLSIVGQADVDGSNEVDLGERMKVG